MAISAHYCTTDHNCTNGQQCTNGYLCNNSHHWQPHANRVFSDNQCARYLTLSLGTVSQTWRQTIKWYQMAQSFKKTEATKCYQMAQSVKNTEATIKKLYSSPCDGGGWPVSSSLCLLHDKLFLDFPLKITSNVTLAKPGGWLVIRANIFTLHGLDCQGVLKLLCFTATISCYHMSAESLHDLVESQVWEYPSGRTLLSDRWVEISQKRM